MNQKHPLNMHLPFVQKMLQRARTTEYEDSWKNLLELIQNAHSLTEEKVSIINSTLSKLVQKLDIYKSSVKNDVNVEPLALPDENENHQGAPENASNTQPQPTIARKAKKKKKRRKAKFFNVSDSFPIKMMSPRRERIPILRIKLSEINKIKRRKHNEILKEEQQKNEPPADISASNEEPTNEKNSPASPIRENSMDSNNLRECFVMLERVNVENDSLTQDNVQSSQLGLKRKSTESYDATPPSVLKTILSTPSKSPPRPSVLKSILSSPLTRSRRSQSREQQEAPIEAASVLKSILSSPARPTNPAAAPQIPALVKIESIVNDSATRRNSMPPSLVNRSLTEALASPILANGSVTVRKITRSSATAAPSKNEQQKFNPSKPNNEISLNATFDPFAKPLATVQAKGKSTPPPSTRLQDVARRNSVPAQHINAFPVPSGVLRTIARQVTASCPKAPISHEPVAPQASLLLAHKLSARKSTQSNPPARMSPVVNKNSAAARRNSLPAPPPLIGNAIFKVPATPPPIKHEKPTQNAVKITNNAPMVAIPTSMVFPIFSSGQDKKILLSAEYTTKKIRPWLDTSTHRKVLQNCEEMLANGNCLAAVFKCMGSSCSYFTNQPSIFKHHLELHRNYDAEDSKNFQRCCYCNYETDSLNELVDHIFNIHGSSKYQCPHCFFRSYDFHINTHLKYIHNSKSEIAIECKPINLQNTSEDLTAIWRDFLKECRAITCFVCKSKFYNIANFTTHIKSHKVVPSFKCMKCEKVVNRDSIIFHLKKCHGFGNFSCAFCNFAVDSLEIIKRHLTNHHPEKLLLYFDRSTNSNQEHILGMQPMSKEDVSKVLVLKQLASYSSRKDNNIKVFNNKSALDNAENVAKGFSAEMKAAQN